MQLDIRPCTEEDVELLDAYLPGDGDGLHLSRFRRQQRGGFTYLVAVLGARPVGHLLIRWDGSVHGHVQKMFPATPEIRRFCVDERFRGSGIGSLMLDEAERLVGERGYDSVGLAVGVDNLGAQRLYSRRQYEDWRRGTFDSRWIRIVDGQPPAEHHHVVTYMRKMLRVDAETVAVA